MADKNSINLGRVLPIYKGDWSANTNYDILDIVYYNGNSYTAKQPSTNQEPKADSAYWGLSSVKGQKGDKGDKGDTGPQGPAGKDADIPVIGGRNLLLDTGRSFTGVGDNSTNGNFNAQGGTYLLAGDKKVSDFYNQYGSSGYLTLSFDWVANGSTISGKLNPVWNNTPWGGLATDNGIQPSSTNKTGHYENTVQLNRNGYPTGTATNIMFRQDNLQGNIIISNMKLEAGNIATDWTPAPEDVPSGLSIGGRNYVQNSSGLNGSSTVRPTLMGASSLAISATLTYQSDGILMTNLATNTTTEWIYQVASAWTNFSDTPLAPGKPITFSVDVMGTVPQAVLRYDINDGAAGRQNYKFFDINNTNWTRISITGTPTSTDTRFYFRIQGGKNNQYASGWSGGETLKFRYVKIEEGNLATDWTPALEDVDNAIANVQTIADNASTNVTNLGHKVDGLGQTNLLVNSDFYYDLQGWDTTGGSKGASIPYASYINKDVNARLVGFNTTGYTDRLYSRLRQTVNLANNPTGQSKITVQWQAYANTLTTYGHLFMSFFTGFDGTGDVVVLTDVGDSQSKVGDNAAMWDLADKSLEGWAVRHGTTTIPDNAKSVQLSFETVEGNILYLANPMLAFGDSISTYTSGPYYPKDDIQSLKDHAIRDNVSGQSVQGDLTVGHIMEAEWLYKHVPSAGATPFLEIDDTNLGIKQAIGHYYSAFSHGSGVTLGAGGLTIVGGGESAKGLGDAIDKGLPDVSASGLPISDHGNEHTVIAADGYIYFMPGQQSGYPTLGPAFRFSSSGYLDKYTGSGWTPLITPTSTLLAQDSQVVHKSSDESIAGDKKFSGKVTVDNAAKYPLNTSVPLNSTKMLYGTISAIRVGNLVQATYNKPNSTDKVGVNTTSSESVPADFRPLAGVKGAGTDSSGGTVDITLNPNGTLTTGNTYIDSGKSATITFTYPVL